MMWKNKWIAGLMAVALNMPLQAQNVVLKGKIGGDIRNKAALISLDGDTLVSCQMERGAFLLSYPGMSGLYKVSIGKYEKVFFLPADTVRVSGYVDRLSGESDVTLSNTDLHKRMLGYMGQVNQVGETYKKWVRDTLATLPESQVSDMEIVLLVQEDSVKSRAIAGLVRQETNPALAAAVAFLSCGKLYEDVAFVYESLTEDARNTQPGRLLAEKKDRLASVADGMPAPDCMLVNLNGEKVSLAQLRGKPVVLDFWASWCGPCRREMAYLKKVYEELGADKVSFVSISLDDTRQQWENSCAEEKVEWLNLWDEAGFQNSVVRKLYHFDFIPFCVVLDAEGRIVKKNLRRNKLRDTLYSIIK